MKHLSKLLLIGILLEVVVFIFSYFEANNDITHFFQSSARLSGRVSLLYFSLLFIYDTIKPTNNDAGILQTKYTLALNFAVLHIIHWFLLAIAVSMSGFELVPFRVAGGALAYGMIATLPFVIKRKIFTNFSLNLVFPIYLTYVWLIFFFTYLTRIQGKATHVTGNMLTYKILGAVTVILMVWRIVVLFARKRNSSKV